MSISPDLHVVLLGTAVVSALVCAGIILARNPVSAPAELHAIYGGAVAWWFFCMAMVAGADSSDDARLWARLVYLSIGLLPGIIYHLGASTAGVAHEHRRGIRVIYGLSAALVVFGLSWPDLLAEPRRFSWGLYPRYTAWGIGPVLLLLVVFPQVLGFYRVVLRRAEPGSSLHRKARAFLYGNCIAIVAAVDFFPAFGVPIYPFGYVIIIAMQAATAFGAVRYKLIEITPQFAAERILDTIPTGLLVVDAQGLVRVANGAAARMLGRGIADLVNHSLDEVVDDPNLRDAFRSTNAGPAGAHEISFEIEPGMRRVVALSESVVTDQEHRPLAHVWVLHDLTGQRLAEAERVRLEGWVRQKQKLETVGVMAGGVAHDFNNILMAIMGSSELASADLPPESPARQELGRIMAGVERAAELTRQLLLFSGRGVLTSAAVDLNTAVREMAELMHSAVSKKATPQTELSEQLPSVIGDASQIRQVVLNLITNASEAMQDVPGTITVRTGSVEPNSKFRRMLGKGGGSDAATYVFLEITDTGSGIDPAARARIFDPFFTTKFTGRGLGLATVMGIAQRHGGLIDVESEPGRGARFTVVLPVAADTHVQPSLGDATSASWRGAGVALLADDEVSVRRVARQMLIDQGFDIVEAADGAEAVAIFRARRQEIALVVLDGAMPVMTGWKCGVSRATFRSSSSAAIWILRTPSSTRKPHASRSPSAARRSWRRFGPRWAGRKTRCAEDSTRATAVQHVYRTATLTLWIGGSESNRHSQCSPPSLPIQSWPVVVPR